MPPERKNWKNEDCPDKRKKIIWNDQDCVATVCLRPAGTSNWVQCDNCSGWYHVECLPQIKLEDINEDVEFFCPTCIPEKQQEFQNIKDKLKRNVEELAARQVEFGGVTIDRDMFKEKKMANPYNYSKDFPPTLRDLALRIQSRHQTLADFKSDYKLMCSKLTEHLKDDFESRIEMVEWELDDIVEDVMKPDEPEIEDKNDDDDNDKENDEDDLVEGEEESSFDEENHGGLCDNCLTRFPSPIIYNCIRKHRVCYPCRNLITGCICPCCYKQFGDRKRMFQDNTSAMLYRLANASNFGPATSKKKPSTSKKVPQFVANLLQNKEVRPMIMNVWSCAEEEADTLVMDAPVTVKKELQDESSSSVSMSTVIPETDLGSNMLTLIDPSIVDKNPSPGLVNEQQPVNYNDTEEPVVPLSTTSTIDQSESSVPVKKRRLSGEEWMQSLDTVNCHSNVKINESTNSKLWERYQQRAKLSSDYSINVNSGTGVKVTQYKVNPASSTVTSGQLQRSSSYVPEGINANEPPVSYQPSDTDRYQTGLNSATQHPVLIQQLKNKFTSPPKPQVNPKMSLSISGQRLSNVIESAKNIVDTQVEKSQKVLLVNKSQEPIEESQKVLLVNKSQAPMNSQLLTSTNLLPTFSSAPNIRFHNPPQLLPPRRIIIRNPAFPKNPLDVGEATVTGDTDGKIDEDAQFITPDQIQESFNEIEKYLVADDDNIFEKLEGDEMDLEKEDRPADPLSSMPS